MSTPRDEIPLRPPNLTARAAAYGDGPVQVVRNGRGTPARSAVDQLATLIDLVSGLRRDVAAINERLDEIEPRVAAAVSSADRAHDEAAAVRTYVLGLHDRLYDLHDAIDDHAAARPDAAVISLIHNTDNEEN